MTKQEAILVSAYTGYLLTKKFSDVHGFCEKLLGRSIFTHEFADEKLWEEIREKCIPMIEELVDKEVE